ncbi:hypothetical protein EV683_11135 [Crenobacter luteus]|uniref:NADH-ubiquinone oxidoreductase subunit 6 n=1 Tax=Crenobacter luteus TaxID=1452487 RepID=A0A165F5L5_9NEIS|nr:FAD-dependent oxidoreductase [Crenobacter luteus]KZE31483.1 NADH-ubiquinone oxidoreductase subunit 6 [Crenobacter luteus]TCP11811.1 hypothetical protein EV683_11135 [Crenobacter luteus]
MNIAVIGSGIAGLSSAWLLSRAGHRVTLFEANDYVGGHSNTVDVTLNGLSAPVDTGFLVHNDRTYPNLIALFEHLGVATHPSEMSFSVSLDKEALEWAGTSLATLFAQRRNLVRPRFWGMLGDVLRLHRSAPRMLDEARRSGETLGELLARHRFGAPMRDWYLYPMCAAIWSGSTRHVADFPAATLFEFCANHGLMQLFGRPQWRTVLGGAREYVARMVAAVADVRVSCPVERVVRDAAGVTLRSPRGRERFEQVVLACHADQALRMLAETSDAEYAVLSAIRYQRNRAVLHADVSFLPGRRAVWAAWNYRMAEGGVSEAPSMVSYLINKLQPLPFASPVIVTLNPYREPESVWQSFDYEHPVFDSAAIAAQRRLAELQGRHRTWYAGAWAGYGFHEDGLKAGMAVAQALGAPVPWLSAGGSAPVEGLRALGSAAVREPA